MMSNFELFEQREYERNCSNRISPRKARNNKLLPPECHQIISSSCNERVSPRRQRGIDCLDFLGSQQPVTSPNQTQSSSGGTRRFTVVASNNGNNDGSNDRNGSNGRSTTSPSAEIVIVPETGSVSSNNQDIEKFQQEINNLRQENYTLRQNLLNCRRQQEPRQSSRSSESSDSSYHTAESGSTSTKENQGQNQNGSVTVLDDNTGFFGPLYNAANAVMNFIRGGEDNES